MSMVIQLTFGLHQNQDYMYQKMVNIGKNILVLLMKIQEKNY